MEQNRVFRIPGRFSPEIAGIAGVFSLKAVTTGLSFALILLAARAFGAGEFGSYSILFSAAGLLSVAATFGQHVLLMRSWSEYCSSDRPDLLKGSLVFSGLAIGIGATIFAVPFFLWCASVYGWELGAIVAIYLASLSMMMGTTHLVRSAVSVAVGDGWSYVLPLTPAVLYLGVCMLGDEPASMSALFAIMAAGAIAAIAIHAVTIRRTITRRFPAIASTRPAFDFPTWTARSVKLWISSGLEAANQFIDVIIVGLLLSPEAAGVYFVLSRLANVIAVGADAIYMYATRHLPALYYGKDFVRLNGMLDAVAWATLAVALIGVLVVALGGHWLLMAFNAAYVPYHTALLLLSCGVAAAVSAGPSASILMLTGHEGRYLSIMAGTIALRIIAMVALVPWLHAYGAVIASTVSVALMALLVVVSSRTLTGIDGSILRLLPQPRPELFRTSFAAAERTPPAASAMVAKLENRPPSKD